ncbi:TadE/TadG family type IV pilus assembly protein [Motiliproteus sp. SC1-56]|uniref:TadE/TadG family type IV pilus assembly protein n=1 Tax=Motiliproteus sp. SC1-56 TaxID=2799565 RepID=UPI001A90C019|nr:TadE/TadG family type IV pilus assembly protein [Motiliproteus sp. SC1-56]
MNRLHNSHSVTAKRQQGIAVVEMTLVLPLLLLLVLAVAELGRVLYQYNILTQAQRDGARYLASVAIKGSTGEIELNETVGANADRTRKLIVYGNVAGTGTPLLSGLSTSDVAVTVASPTHIRVDVVYNFTPIWDITLPTFGYGAPISLNFPLRSSMVMRAL